jgi:hypothetical protein
MSERDDTIIVIEESIPPIAKPSASKPTIIVILIISLAISATITRDQSIIITIAITPFIGGILWLIFDLLISYTNFSTKLFPIRATINKNTNILTLEQLSSSDTKTTQVHIDEITKIETYGNRFYYPEMANGILLNQAQPETTMGVSCGINFYLTSGEIITVNTGDDTYTGAYKTLADKLGKAINIPVDK